MPTTKSSYSRHCLPRNNSLSGPQTLVLMKLYFSKIKAENLVFERLFSFCFLPQFLTKTTKRLHVISPYAISTYAISTVCNFNPLPFRRILISSKSLHSLRNVRIGKFFADCVQCCFFTICYDAICLGVRFFAEQFNHSGIGFFCFAG